MQYTLCTLPFVLLAISSAFASDPTAIRYEALRDQWKWIYDSESTATYLEGHVESVEAGTQEQRYDQYVYDLMIVSRDLPYEESGFQRTLNWVDRKLRRKLRRAGLIAPESGVYPTHAESIPHLEPLLNRGRGIWPFRKEAR